MLSVGYDNATNIDNDEAFAYSHVRLPACWLGLSASALISVCHPSRTFSDVS